MSGKPLELRHGKSHTPEWEAWRAMLKRCYKPNTRNYDRYGGRGIVVCDRWRESFQNFYADMGPKPSSRRSLHRKNNDGNYDPDNCEWALPVVQANNRSYPRRNIVRASRNVRSGGRPYNFSDLTGKRFGRWLIVGYHGNAAGRSGGAIWLCRCDCGNERPVKGKSLTSGHSNSCGCLHKEIMAEWCSLNHIKRGKTHNLSRTREYASWNQMIQRCHNPKNPTYERYGAKGTTVCDRWRGTEGFTNFLADMGPCPQNHTLDRKSSFGNYEPGNCRWATDGEQRLNQRRTKRFAYKGEELTLPELAAKTGIMRGTLRFRLVNQGWSVERATTQDPKEYHRRT